MIDYSFEAWNKSEEKKAAEANLQWPKDYWHIVRDIWMDKEDEQLRMVQPGDVVVDAGATIGAFTVKAALQAGEKGHVFAFEPEPDNFRLLKSNTSKLKNITLHRKALWNIEKMMEFWITATYRAGHSLGANNTAIIKRDNYSGHIHANTVTLDEVIDRKVNFLKMDIEGAELQALQGAKRILAESFPFIAMEVHHQLEEIKDFLAQFGYQIHHRKGREKCTYGTMYFM